MEQFKELIQDTVDKMQKITELLYQQKTKQAYKNFEEVLDSMYAIAQSMFELEWVTEDDKVEYANKLKEALAAMESKDSILLSDILQYEIIVFLEELRDKVL